MFYCMGYWRICNVPIPLILISESEVKDFLKLMGISTKSWDGGIEIKTISWEK